MNRNTLFTFGAHTTYHDIMSKQSEEQLSLDIQTSINLLRMNLSEQVKHFSYPEGQKEHFSDGAIKILKSCGIKCCPTAIPGQNSHLCDPFSLKRIMVRFNDTPSQQVYANLLLR